MIGFSDFWEFDSLNVKPQLKASSKITDHHRLLNFELPTDVIRIKPAGGAGVYISSITTCVCVEGGDMPMTVCQSITRNARSYLQAVSNECACRCIVEENQSRQEKTRTDAAKTGTLHRTPQRKPGIKAGALCMKYAFHSKST